MITRKLEYNNTFARSPCAICGCEYEAEGLEWRLRGAGGMFGFKLLCYECGEADRQTLHQRLQEHIKDLQEYIDELKALHKSIDEMITDVSVVQKVMNRKPRDPVEEGCLKYATKIADIVLA